MEAKCEDCKFYEYPIWQILFDREEIEEMDRKGMSFEDKQKQCINEHESGECHRYPPILISSNKDICQNKQSDVFRDDWCGEFKPKNENDNQVSAFEI